MLVVNQRRTNLERRTETRSRLLESAAEVFARRGYAAASVNEIVEGAGCSTGALYAHFEGKGDLFLSLMDETIPGWAGYYGQGVDATETLDDALRVIAERWVALIDKRPDQWTLFLEFWSVAMRDSSLLPEFAGRYSDIRGAMAALIANTAEQFDLELNESVDSLAAIVTALADGLAMQRLANPDQVSEELFLKALQIVFGTAGAPGNTV